MPVASATSQLHFCSSLSCMKNFVTCSLPASKVASLSKLWRQAPTLRGHWKDPRRPRPAVDVLLLQAWRRQAWHVRTPYLPPVPQSQDERRVKLKMGRNLLCCEQELEHQVSAALQTAGQATSKKVLWSQTVSPRTKLSPLPNRWYHWSFFVVTYVLGVWPGHVPPLKIMSTVLWHRIERRKWLCVN